MNSKKLFDRLLKSRRVWAVLGALFGMSDGQEFIRLIQDLALALGK